MQDRIKLCQPEITLIVLRGAEPMELKGTARRSLFGPARPPAKGR